MKPNSRGHKYKGSVFTTSAIPATATITPPHFLKKEFRRFFLKKEHPAYPGLVLLYSSEEKMLKNFQYKTNF
jgi:hypothetical protein